jgi:2-succinyl-6-hydroxy-2,4-cyclohexadiene-1-carboxylate synthase
MPERVVLLHGFGATRRAWDGVIAALDRERYRPLALDLPGHGDTTELRHPLTFDACVAHVLAHSPERFTLCGYSMGGRVALHVALADPERVARLVLVASTAGIDSEQERAERRRADHALADELERGSYEQFIARWRAQPLFAEDPPHVAALAREDQRRNRPADLAAALRGIGTGEMAPLWSRLGELRMPVTVIAGERDHKFRELGERMVKELTNAQLRVVPGGHVLPLESASAVAGALAPNQW